MKKQLALIAFAIALGACTSSRPPAAAGALGAPDASGKITIPDGADVALAAPKSGPVAMDLRKEDAGKTVTLKVGQRFSVSLVGVPTAGYLWTAREPPAFLRLDGQTSGPTHSDQLKPGFTGGTHWEVTVYEVSKPGKGVLTFEQRRPWDSAKEPPSDRWSVTVVAE